MHLVFIYYAYVYNVLHFILNQSINQSSELFRLNLESPLSVSVKAVKKTVKVT